MVIALSIIGGIIMGACLATAVILYIDRHVGPMF